VRIGSFAELGVLREALHQARRDAAAREADERAAQELAAAIARSQPAPHGLFARSVGSVYPLPDRQQAQIELPRPLPHPRQKLPKECPRAPRARCPSSCRSRYRPRPCRRFHAL